jgi:hypothetical protein
VYRGGAYHTGVTRFTDISLKPRPRMPSNLATRKASPGSLVASAKVCAPLDQKKHLQINAQIKKVMFYFIKNILQRTQKKRIFTHRLDQLLQTLESKISSSGRVM